MMTVQAQMITNGVPLICLNRAARHFHVPAVLLLSVLKTENGKPGLVHHNRNHSIDVGPMQINSRWFSTFKHYGYSQGMLTYNACANVMAGAWLLGRAIADNTLLWRGVGDYHSHTPLLNVNYQHGVMQWYHTINTALTR